MIKGGASMLLRFGTEARYTQDLDSLTSLDLNTAFDQISERLAQGWEGFTGQIAKREPIVNAGVTPPPERCKIKLSYKSRPFSTIDFEIAQTQTQTETIEQIKPAIPLDQLLLSSEQEIPVLGVHYQIAQKLHACTEPRPENDNQRVHDLYDICLLRPLAEQELGKTRQACINTFAERNTHTWPPTLPDNNEWQQLWNEKGVSRLDRITYQDARTEVTKLINKLEPTPDPEKLAKARRELTERRRSHKPANSSKRSTPS
jgi:hypothetical protein